MLLVFINEFILPVFIEYLKYVMYFIHRGKKALKKCN